MKKPLLFLFFLSYNSLFAQLGFCEGSKGDPIFHENFENINGPLPPGITSYRYITGYDPGDGEYSISSAVGQTNGSWHSYFPSNSISRGKALVINANDVTAGKFYEKEISGLCENTSYEFSAFLINVFNASHSACNNNDIPINVRFEIWDGSNANILKQGSTGNLTSTSNPLWKRFALTFRSEAAQEAVILKIYNNGIGGCGNDLAIDDIIFSSCGDFTEITSENKANPYLVCESKLPVSLTLIANPDLSVYSQHAYQWQESDDEETWQDIPGETHESFETPLLSTSKFYRVKVAEDKVNISNNLCSSASEAFFIKILKTPQAPVNPGDVVVCGDENIPPLGVVVEDDEIVNWYDAMVDGNLLAEGTNTYLSTAEGTFYAEALKENADCVASPRTAVRLIKNEVPQIFDEFLRLCKDSVMQLDSGVSDMQYQWSTGAITKQIEIAGPGNFSVDIITPDGCMVIKNFEVTPVEVAEIGEIISEENLVTIIPAYSGVYEYSLDGTNFQDSNTFENVPGGVYTAYIRDLSGCNTFSREFPQIVIPRFITPNNDGYNDFFRLNGVEYFESSSISIFDRYGKLIISGNGENFSWDGTFHGKIMASQDYWYKIQIENFKEITGNVSLKN